jgi:serine protease Do
LQSGDVIVEFNGQPVQDASQLKLRVAETNPGASVPVVVMRNGERKTLKAFGASLYRSKIPRPQAFA